MVVPNMEVIRDSSVLSDNGLLGRERNHWLCRKGDTVGLLRNEASSCFFQEMLSRVTRPPPKSSQITIQPSILLWM